MESETMEFNPISKKNDSTSSDDDWYFETGEAFKIEKKEDLSRVEDQPLKEGWISSVGNFIRLVFLGPMEENTGTGIEVEAEEEEEEEEEEEPRKMLEIIFFFIFGCCGVCPSGKHLFNLFGIPKAVKELFSREKEEKKKKKKKKGMGMVFGVIIPVILNIFGVILFLRLPMGIGNAGILFAIVIFGLGYLVTSITITSICAISTNGTVKSGGAYYMISRVLGPELGGAIGFIFFCANVAGGALYIIGFIESFISVIPEAGEYLGNDYWTKVVDCSLILILMAGVCLVGADFFGKTGAFILVFLTVSLIATIFSFSFMELLGSSIFNRMRDDYGYTGWRWSTFKDNFMPYENEQTNIQSIFAEVVANCSSVVQKTISNITSYDAVYSSANCSVTIPEEIDSSAYYIDVDTKEQLNFQKVFSILFPACTGAMAGVNLSGDLEDPQKAIPIGTIFATALTFVIYMFLILMFGSTMDRFSLVSNYAITSDVSFLPILVSIGIFAATISSGLTSIIGGSRILYALAKDNLLPFLGLFSVETSGVPLVKKEPRIAVVFTAVLIQCLLFFPSIGYISPFVTQFFLVAYGFVNFTCFALGVTQAPNFRPNFKYHSPIISFIGVALCIFIMIYLDWLKAGITFGLVLVIIVVIYIYAKPKPWGDIIQSFIYFLGKKFQVRINTKRDEHIKYWRFKSLALIPHPRTHFSLIHFLDDLSRSKGGLCVIGNVKTGDYRNMLEEYKKDRAAFYDLIQEAKLSLFFEITFSNTLRQGIQNLLLHAGFSGMHPDIVVIGFYERRRRRKRKDSFLKKKKTWKEEIMGDFHEISGRIEDMEKKSEEVIKEGEDVKKEEGTKIQITNVEEELKTNEEEKGEREEKDELAALFEDSDEEDETEYFKRGKKLKSLYDFSKYRIEKKHLLQQKDKSQDFQLTGSKTIEDLQKIKLMSEETFYPLKEYMKTLIDILLFKSGLIITANFRHLKRKNCKPKNLIARILRMKLFTIDLWIFSSFSSGRNSNNKIHGSISLMFQLGGLLLNASIWRKYHKLRILLVVDEGGKKKKRFKKIKKNVKEMLNLVRLQAEIKVVVIDIEEVKEFLAEEYGVEQAPVGSKEKEEEGEETVVEFQEKEGNVNEKESDEFTEKDLSNSFMITKDIDIDIDIDIDGAKDVPSSSSLSFELKEIPAFGRKDEQENEENEGGKEIDDNSSSDESSSGSEGEGEDESFSAFLSAGSFNEFLSQESEKEEEKIRKRSLTSFDLSIPKRGLSGDFLRVIPKQHERIPTSLGMSKTFDNLASIKREILKEEQEAKENEEKKIRKRISFEMGKEFDEELIAEGDVKFKFVHEQLEIRIGDKLLTNIQKMKFFNRVIKKKSLPRTSLIFVTLPPPPKEFSSDSSYETYYEMLESLTHGLEPTLLIYSSKNVISTEL